MKKSQQLGVCWLSLRSASSLLTRRQRDIKDPGKCSDSPIDTAFCGACRSAQDCFWTVWIMRMPERGSLHGADGAGPSRSCSTAAPGTRSGPHTLAATPTIPWIHCYNSRGTCLPPTTPVVLVVPGPCQTSRHSVSSVQTRSMHRWCYMQGQNPEGHHKPSLSKTSSTHIVHTGRCTHVGFYMRSLWFHCCPRILC